MTLIVGTLCADGMFFCSDSEESTALGNKSVKKLYSIGGQSWHMFLGAAGFGPLCDVAIGRIAAEAKLKETDFLAFHESIVGEEIGAIYDKYIHYSLPHNVQYERQISVVVGIVDKDTRRGFLYRTHEEIFQPISDLYACAGAGKGIADYYLGGLFQDFRAPTFSGRIPLIKEAERLIQFVMKEAKESVGGVGGNTNTMSFFWDSPQSVGDGSFGSGWDARQPNLRDLIDHFWLENPKA